MKKRTVVIGAGPAGMMAAGTAAKRGIETILLEKNKRPGTKLLLTGKGRCNITNNTDIQGLIDNTPGNGSFLYSAFYTFSNEDIIRFFNENRLPTKLERGGRIFPESDRAADVRDTLLSYAEKNGARLCLSSPAESVIVESGKVAGVKLKNGSRIDCDSVIIATGGLSYPKTGSTGDGYVMAKECGHVIIPPKPSLVPLEVHEDWVRELQGLTLKNVSILLTDTKGKKIYSDFGEMLFTHFGVSGPVILSCSRHILDMDYRDVTLTIDLKPALTLEKLDERIKRDFEKFSRKQFKNSLGELLPKKLIPVIVRLSGISGEKFVNQITRQERRELAGLLKGLKLRIKGTRPIDEAVVTAGGVCTDEINPSTMESKLIKGLFFAGEVIDVDAYTGGFNLTIAFSTGYLAGMNC